MRSEALGEGGTPAEEHDPQGQGREARVPLRLSGGAGRCGLYHARLLGLQGDQQERQNHREGCEGLRGFQGEEGQRQPGCGDLRQGPRDRPRGGARHWKGRKGHHPGREEVRRSCGGLQEEGTQALPGRPEAGQAVAAGRGRPCRGEAHRCGRHDQEVRPQGAGCGGKGSLGGRGDGRGLGHGLGRLEGHRLNTKTKNP